MIPTWRSTVPAYARAREAALVAQAGENEQNETAVRYLLDDVQGREESRLGGSLAPDVIDSLDKATTIDFGRHSTITLSVNAAALEDLKESILDGVRDLVRAAQLPVESEPPPSDVAAPPAADTQNLTSELQNAKGWWDYITQYWTSNPACYQYHAGADMPPHERKIHRCLLSRTKTIALFVQSLYGDDLERFEQEFTADIGSELTVNKILDKIRRTK
ncbi:hypothetical protein PybrP1_005962 [[Pythium] brassicae (nom. inval.)]|nr:hypothetical protein PybrP1_005962 [[Pythium] brassicae (nom. inval.)]